MTMINDQTREAGKLIIQAMLKNAISVPATMEACMIIAAALVRVESRLGGFSGEDAFAELCEHGWLHCEDNVINIADFRK